MKCMIRFATATLLLFAILAASLHPNFEVLRNNPWAILGMGLIGLGLMRNAQQAIAARNRA